MSFTAIRPFNIRGITPKQKIDSTGTMNAEHTRKKRKKPRISLTEREIAELFTVHGTQSAVQLAKRTGLPYMQIYNIVHRRVRSVSHRTYLQLFGKPPPVIDPLNVDGALFRDLVDLWLFLDGKTSKADLCRELLGKDRRATVDYRIFSGQIARVEARLEHAMLKKFADAGIDRPLLEQWLDKFASLTPDQWVPYARIKPALTFLENTLGISPSSVLHQSVVKYESGSLKRVSKDTADRIQALRNRAQAALRRKVSQHAEKIRESIVGGRIDYTLFSNIEEELLFLNRQTGKGVKQYLGRSLWTYRQGKSKRVADWRARKIIQDCDRLISENPSLPLTSLPPRRQVAKIRPLIEVMMARSAQLLSGEEGMAFEKRILRPSHTQLQYRDPQRRFTPFDMAAGVLGMRRKAFDLMVASHCDIFRTVGKFSRRWYLPNLYLEELARKRHFGLISARYERMARDLTWQPGNTRCLD